MGNAASAAPKLKRQWTSNRKNNNNFANVNADNDGFARYNERELTLLDRMFQDLARRYDIKILI